MLDFRMDTFLAVCQYMNYTRAAEALCITQPAVSQHIRWLEQQYGAPLFRYEGRQLFLTEAGQALRQMAASMKQDTLALRRALAQPPQQTGRLNFGATPTVGMYLLPKPLAAYHKAHPAAPISLRIDNTQRLCSALDAGKIDFAVVEGFFPKENYESLLCRHERYLPVCAAGYRFASPPVHLADLLPETLLVREKGSGNREILRRSLSCQSLELSDFACLIEVGDMNVLKQLLIEGCGVAFLYEAAVEKELASGAVRQIPLDDFAQSHDLCFLWRKGSAFSDQMRRVYETLFPPRGFGAE